LKTSRISRSCSLSIPAKPPAGGRQFVLVCRSRLDATARRPRNIASRAARSRGYFWRIVILLLLSVDGSRAELPVTDRRGFAPLIERVAPAVVSIIASGLTPKGDNSELDQEDESGGKDSVTGSGVILSADGYIVTNYHVIKTATHITVKREDVGKNYQATMVGLDQQTDLALIKISDSNLPTLTFAESGSYHVGDIVLAIGNPLSFANSVALGVISAVGRSLNNSANEDYIQTDAAINPGNSGGALVDVDGKLVGINSMYVPVFNSKVNTGLGFAIASALVKSVYEELKSNGKVDRAYAGVAFQDLTPDLAAMLSLPQKTVGVLVTEVAPNSPAQAAGVHVKDIIQQFNGQAVANSIQLRELITFSRPNSEVSFVSYRNGSVLSTRMRLTRVKEMDNENPIVARKSLLTGLQFGELTEAARRIYAIPGKVHGVLLTHVEMGSAADKLGLKIGMVLCQVDDTVVGTSQQASNALAGLTRGVMYLWTSTGYMYSPVDLNR
jgi:S1-C subfamily serine protease